MNKLFRTFYRLILKKYTKIRNSEGSDQPFRIGKNFKELKELRYTKMKQYYFQPINASIDGKENMKKRPFSKNTSYDW